MNLQDYIAIAIILFLLGIIAWIKCRHWKAEEVSAELVVRAATEAREYFTMWNELNQQFASLQKQNDSLSAQLAARILEVSKWSELAAQWETARNEAVNKVDRLTIEAGTYQGQQRLLTEELQDRKNQIEELHRQLKIKENIIDSQKVSLNRLQGEIKIAKSRNPKTPASSDVRGK